MKFTRRSFGFLVSAAIAWAGKLQPKRDAATVLRGLREGHARFLAGHSKHPHESPKWVRQAGTHEQHPSAIVLCCSDSRVVPELIFDQGLGDLFVVRVAGNVANEDEVASIEYAVEHLHVPLVVVMGHSHCGAVTAVVNGEAMPPEIQHLVVHIEESVRYVRENQPGLQGSALLSAAVERNVVESMQDLAKGGQLLRQHIDAGDLHVRGCVYQIETGKINWLAG